MFSKLFTGRTKTEWRVLERQVAILQREVRELSTKLSTTAGAQLSVRCGDLEAALEALQKSNRREFGRLWKLLPDRDAGPASTPTPETPEQVRARLRTEHGLPTIGKRQNGAGE